MRWPLENYSLPIPDLPERFARGAALNPPDPETFYTGGARGYIDYPFLTERALQMRMERRATLTLPAFAEGAPCHRPLRWWRNISRTVESGCVIG